MTKNGKPKQTRRRYSPEFRSGAIRLVLEDGHSAAKVAADLGVHPSVVAGWVRQAKIDASGGTDGVLTTSEKAELAALRKENRTLRMERDILKKAAAFFAKENA